MGRPPLSCHGIMVPAHCRAATCTTLQLPHDLLAVRLMHECLADIRRFGIISGDCLSI